MYADDTSFIIEYEEETCIQSEASLILKQSCEWFSSHKLIMNPSKTSIINFVSSNVHTEPIVVELNDIQIKSCENTNFLGLQIDSKLNWNTHINNLCKKLNSSLFALRVLRHKIDVPSMIQIYFAVFQSHLSYGILFWGNSSASNMNRLLLIQKKVIRLLAGLSYRESCRESFIQLKIMTVVNLYIFELLLYVNKNLNKINVNAVNHGYETRAKNVYIRTPCHKTRIARKSISNYGATLYNSLHVSFKTKTDSRNFKSKLQSFLLKNPFYTINEFQICMKNYPDHIA